MITIRVRADITRAVRKLGLVEKQAPYATALALTRTAQLVKVDLQREIDSTFDRPTPFTRNALVVKAATKSNLSATVKVKDNAFSGRAAVKWFVPQVYGGQRGLKGFENLLQRAGQMPQGWYAIPARGAPLDQFGNLSGSLLGKILSQLGARRDPGQNERSKAKQKRNRTRQFGRYFAIQPGRSHLPAGIYERASFAHGSAIRMVMVFTPARPTYRTRYRFYELGNALARKYFPAEFRKAAAVAMQSARR